MTLSFLNLTLTGDYYTFYVPKCGVVQPGAPMPKPNLYHSSYHPYHLHANSNPDQDLSKWDVSSVTNMYGMFSGASAFNKDISAWKVGQVSHHHKTSLTGTLSPAPPPYYNSRIVTLSLTVTLTLTLTGHHDGIHVP